MDLLGGRGGRHRGHSIRRECCGVKLAQAASPCRAPEGGVGFAHVRAALRHQAYSAGGGYRHDEVGYNYRLTEMQAAIGLCQLDRLEAVTSARRDNAAFYDQAVDGVRFPRPHVLPSSFHVYHQYVLRVPAGSRVQRDPLQSELDLRGIGTGVHYPVPVHCQQPYRELGADCPAAERASSEMLSIPVHPGVSEADRERVAAALAAL